MLIAALYYPSVFRWEQMLNVVFVFDYVFLLCLFKFLVKPQQNALS